MVTSRQDSVCYSSFKAEDDMFLKLVQACGTWLAWYNEYVHNLSSIGWGWLGAYWFGCYNQYSSYLAIFHTYLENTKIWSQLVGWH